LLLQHGCNNSLSADDVAARREDRLQALLHVVRAVIVGET